MKFLSKLFDFPYPDKPTIGRWVVNGISILFMWLALAFSLDVFLFITLSGWIIESADWTAFTVTCYIIGMMVGVIHAIIAARRDVREFGT